MENEELECINGQSDLEHLEEMALSSDFAHTSEINDSVTYLKELLLERQKYKKLEEQIGCPLEVLAKLVLGAEVYYDHNGLIHTLDEAIELNVDTITGKPCMGNWMPLLSKGVDKLLFCDYKKTWWLKADKSE